MTVVPGARVVVVGVAGSGKTTIGRALAEALATTFVDADDLHPDANRERMARGVPLDDDARRPWLAAVRSRIEELGHAGRGFVLACSLLKRSYRTSLAHELPPMLWVQLAVDAATLRRRLAARRDHFFPASLLADQLATFEPLQHGLVVDGTLAPATIVARIVEHLPDTMSPEGFTRT